MADTGFIFPGTAAGDRNTGVSWSNPDFIKIFDSSRASASLVSNSSRGLAATNFDFSSIPAGATIDGIEVRVGEYLPNLGGAAVFDDCRLILADNSDGSENKNGVLLDFDFDPITDEAGGFSDKWGETITRADVQDVDWGFFVSIAASSTDLYLINYMQMRVFYTEAEPVDPATFTRRMVGAFFG